MHSAVNGGVVIDFVERFVNSSRFDRIHIVVGNHDIKRRDGIVQLAYEFLRDRPKVRIYDRPTSVTIQDKLCLMLPHYIAEGAELPMIENYSSLYKRYREKFDIVVGHFMEESMSFGMTDTIRNIDKLSYKHLCLGHLHIRTNPEIYIGSVYANKINEGDDSRAAWIIADTKTEERLPVFCDYFTVRYPEALPATNAKVPVYTITNCPSEKLARLQYGNIAIRKVIQQLSIPNREGSLEDDSATKNLDPELMFKEFMRLTPTPLDRRVAALCLSLLKNATNLGYDNNRDPGPAILQA